MASSSFFHKPELALRRALELEGIHQDDAALALLHEVLSSRRHRTWSPAYEQIMIAYIDLCLKMFRSREAKDGLHQYRNLAQTQAPGSLEKVIRYLMEKAEQKCTEAKAFVDAENHLASEAGDGEVEAGAGGGGTDDGEDGFAASPQAILLSTMSTDPAKSQRDSTLLLPALKFLWETYRAVLDILRSNSKLEHVYHAAAQAALAFCKAYKRRMEFRHLCDMLRLHLGNLRQYGSILDASAADGSDPKTSNKVRGWEGWTTESIELHLQTRFMQLETASVLHRYTEGFRTVEDIYNILQISQARRKSNPDLPPPKAKLMATYYERLTTLFWVSENYLFHAFAWYKYYTLCREYKRSMSDDTKRLQASAVLLAALCIPQLPADRRSNKIGTTPQEDILKQKMGRMSTLLGFATRNPTRETLLAEIRSKNLLDQVPQYLRDLYVLLESNADPLIMVEQAKPLLEQLKAEVGETVVSSPDAPPGATDTTLGRYVQPLTKVLLLKLVVNLSAAYRTVSMDHLKRLTAGLNLSFEQVEKSIVLLTQTKTLTVKIDHRAGCLRFGNSDLESEHVRSQLTVLAQKLQAVGRRIAAPSDAGAAANTDAVSASVDRKLQVFASVRAGLDREHELILERKNLIEKRKEEAERMAQEKAREEQRLKLAEEATRRNEEEKRIAREQKLREQEKQKRIQVELENREKKRFLAAMGKKADEISDEQMAQIDTEALQREHQEKIAKKREEAERKTRDAAKKFDYLVRAIRIEELPIITKRYEEKIKMDKERYEQETVEKAKEAKLQWEADVKDRALLQEHEVFGYMTTFEEKVMVGRKALHEAACAAAEELAEIEAERGKLDRARKRKQDEAKRLAEEEANRQKEEEAARLEEERRKREEAKRAKEEKEEELRQAEIRRMDEERRKKEAEQQTNAPAAPGKYVPPSRRNAAGASSGPSSGGGGPPRFGGGGTGVDSGPRYQGGGRYEGRSNTESGSEPRGDGWRGGGWRGGGGGSDAADRDRRPYGGGGGGGGSDAADRDRRPPYGGGGGGGGDAADRDRRPYGGAGSGDRDRRGGYGGRDDRGAGGSGRDDRGGDGQNQRWR